MRDPSAERAARTVFRDCDTRRRTADSPAGIPSCAHRDRRRWKSAGYEQRAGKRKPDFPSLYLLLRPLDNHFLPLPIQRDKAGVPARHAHGERLVAVGILLRTAQNVRVDHVDLHEVAAQREESAQQSLQRPDAVLAVHRAGKQPDVQRRAGGLTAEIRLAVGTHRRGRTLGVGAGRGGGVAGQDVPVPVAERDSQPSGCPLDLPPEGGYAGRKYHRQVMRPRRTQIGKIVQQTHGAFVWANIIQNTNFAQLKTVVIELPASGDLIEAVKALAKHLDAGTSLILLGRESSVVFYHQLKRAGATDYYPLTTAPEEIAYGVKASLEPQQEQEAPVGGRVIAVFGAGYGIGAGTTATVLAAELAQTDPVIVVDAGLLMPSVGSYLGVDVPGSLPKMLQAQDRLDAVLVNQSLVEPRKGLKLLDGYEPFGSGQRVTDCSRLVRELARQAPWQIWRIPVSTPYARSLAAQADFILPVAANTFTSMRCAQTISTLLADVKPEGKVWWIFNHRNASDTVKTEEAAKYLNTKFAAEVPFVKSLGENLIEPLKWLSGNNAFKKTLTPVTAALQSGAELNAAGASFWSRLWK